MKLKTKLLPLINLTMVGAIGAPFALTSCSTDIKNCTVTMDLDGGTLNGETGTITKVVPKGTKLSSLGKPNRFDHVFKYWEHEGSAMSDDDIINSNIHIRAVWEEEDPETCTITIDLNGGVLDGEEGNVTRTVTLGSTYSILGTPTKLYYDFAGWEKDQAIVDQEDIITNGAHIKATWTPTATPVITKKTAKVYRIKTDAESFYLEYEDSQQTQDTYLINDGKVPYVELEDLFDKALYGFYYNITRQGKIFIVQNLITSATCTFNFNDQTITFSDYDKFTYYYTTYANNPLAAGCGGGEDYVVNRVDDYTSGGTYTINLQKYSIPIYCDGDGGYIPYNFCYNIFDCKLLNGIGAMTDSFTFIGNNFYEILDRYNNYYVSEEEPCTIAYYFYNYIAKGMEGITGDIFDTNYREYCYNQLALTLDTRFGMTTRPSRANDGQTIEYFPDGAYESLKEYHDNFISGELDSSNNAMINIMKDFCDDGGHAGYQGCDVTTYNPWSRTTDTVGPETVHTSLSSSLMSQARAKAGHDLPSYIDPDTQAEIKYDSNIEVLSSTEGVNDIVWVTFDQFIYKTPNYDQIDGDNYMENGTIGMTMRLQQIVNAPDSPIKKIIIDLSNNGGGTVCTEHILASYLCGRDNQCEPQDGTLGPGGVTHTIWNPHSKAFSKYTYYADINQDGYYNEDDYLPDDVQVYCIVSDNSFSCGNMLPSHLADCSNCKFIGSRSGGGACYVDSNMEIGLGNVFRSSSNYHSLKNASTLSNKITVDEGVIAEYYPILCDEANAMHFFNREEIIAYINSNL